MNYVIDMVEQLHDNSFLRKSYLLALFKSIVPVNRRQVLRIRLLKMPLKIFLSSTLRKHIPGYDPIKGTVLSLDRRIAVAELCELMNIPEDRIKIVMINGKSKSLDYELKGDERIGLFPPIGGG